MIFRRIGMIRRCFVIVALVIVVRRGENTADGTRLTARTASGLEYQGNDGTVRCGYGPAFGRMVEMSLAGRVGRCAGNGWRRNRMIFRRSRMVRMVRMSRMVRRSRLIVARRRQN